MYNFWGVSLVVVAIQEKTLTETLQRCRWVFKSGWASSNMVGLICPLVVVIGLTELSNSGWAKASPAQPLAVSLHCYHLSVGTTELGMHMIKDLWLQRSLIRCTHGHPQIMNKIRFLLKTLYSCLLEGRHPCELAHTYCKVVNSKLSVSSTFKDFHCLCRGNLMLGH